MKNILLLFVGTVLFCSCENQETRYANDGPEIDLLNNLITDYEKGDWESWKSKYADTAKIRHNLPKDKFLTPDEQAEGFKQGLSALSSYKFDPETIDTEKIIDEKGRTWVNFWGTWNGTVAANNEKIVIPVHLTSQIKDGKIVEEYAYFDSSELQSITNTAANQDIIDTVVKAWNTNDKTLMTSVMTDDFVRTENGMPIANNPVEYGQFMDVFITGFPDFKVSLDSLETIGNKIYINWTVTGTNTGTFQGNKATGKPITTHGLSIWHLNNNGKVSREDAFYDNLTVYEQLEYKMPTLK